MFYAPPGLIEVSPSGVLGLPGQIEDKLVCTAVWGTLGDEIIECVSDEKFHQVEGVKSLVFSNGGSPVIVALRNIQSPTELTGFNLESLTLDYVSDRFHHCRRFFCPTWLGFNHFNRFQIE